MVSTSLTIKIAKKGKSMFGLPGMLLAGAIALFLQIFAKRKLEDLIE